MNEQIQPHNEKAAAMWSSGGRAYDEVSRFIAEGIEHCVIRLAPKPGERVLDVATGTGWTSRRVADHGAKVTGIDIAEGMLAAAREIAGERSLDIDYRLADAEALPFADGEFDAVISTCGVMFAGNREAAAAELARVCRKGGRLALMTWPPESNAVELRKVLAPYMPPPPSPPPPSPFDWGRPEWLGETLGAAFEFAFETGTLYHRVPDGEAGCEVMATGFGPVKALVESLDDEKWAAAKADLVAFFEHYREEIGVAMPLDYLIAVGTRR
jgi:SAM-dependent methyltransferase